MKKYLICLLAVASGIAASAFTTENTVKKATPQQGTYLWWDFNGGLLQQWNPAYYSIDDNQYPECFYALGLITCEIKALSQELAPNMPDLSNVISIRYRPLI
jgi:hypothetical protein